MNPNLRVSEPEKKIGVFYALANDGTELPVIDITHPAFEPPAAKDSRVVRFPRFLSVFLSRILILKAWGGKILFHRARRRSILAEGIRRAEGTFLDGMSTYRMKLGAENLGRGHTGTLDRKIASSPLSRSLLKRLKEMAGFLAEGLAPLLAAKPGQSLRLLNLGGGPAMDSLNALILLAHENLSWLQGRRVRLDVLDLEKDGPDFGARALRALQAPGGPLRGLEIEFNYLRYDWGDAAPLKVLLEKVRPEGAVMAGSSEGALFSYASDGQIDAHLEILRADTPGGFFLAGSMAKTESGGRGKGPALKSRDWKRLEFLARKSGWSLEKKSETLFSRHFCLRKK